jgi:hypothetical protein
MQICSVEDLYLHLLHLVGCRFTHLLPNKQISGWKEHLSDVISMPFAGCQTLMAERELSQTDVEGQHTIIFSTMLLRIYQREINPSIL